MSNRLGIGEHVPYQVQLDSVKAEIIGTTTVTNVKGQLQFDQYILLQAYYHQNERGEWVQARRTYYRDRKFIEGLYQDAGGCL